MRRTSSSQSIIHRLRAENIPDPYSVSFLFSRNMLLKESRMVHPCCCYLVSLPAINPHKPTNSPSARTNIRWHRNTHTITQNSTPQRSNQHIASKQIRTPRHAVPRRVLAHKTSGCLFCKRHLPHTYTTEFWTIAGIMAKPRDTKFIHHLGN